MSWGTAHYRRRASMPNWNCRRWHRWHCHGWEVPNTFAVTCLRRWYQQGRDVQALLPQLSVYLGHVRPQDSYWYLSAVPELLNAAAEQFRTYAMAGGEGHE
jgi:hypothetical protein